MRKSEKKWDGEMNRQKLVLIVDDTEMNRAMLADMLAAEYKIVEASDGRQAVGSVRCV